MAHSKMVYKPREDSFLLQEQVRKFAKGRVLDVGTGSGIQAETAARKKSVRKVLAVDVDKKAVEFCRATIRDRKIKFIVGDLFSSVKGKQKFDTIIFNPPYLPEEQKQEQEPEERTGELALAGGKKGYEILERFLKQAGSFLKPGGIILVVFSSLTGKEKVDSLVEENLFDAKLLSSRHIFFEDLYVYLLKKKKLLTELEKKGVEAMRYFARGKRGVVYAGVFKGKKVAVKTKKKESLAIGRMKNEARMLRLLNLYNIGPKLLFAGSNYVVYEFAEGEYLVKWLPKAKRQAIIAVLKSAFAQAFQMDRLGIAKEEMHRPLKHVVVGRKKGQKGQATATLIDFERAHKTEKPHNVTQLCQYVLSIRRLLARKGLKIDKQKTIAAARAYKAKPSQSAFVNILKLLK